MASPTSTRSARPQTPTHSARACCPARGVEVCLIEAAPTPLHAQLGPRLGAWFARLHRDAGVRVLLGTRIERFRGDARTLHALELDDGTRVECDALLAGVGVRPETAWLEPAGLPPTGIPAGPDGVAAAHGMLGLDPPPHPRPSFWSDQYGIRIQFAGDARGADAIELDGDPDAHDFTALFLQDGVVRAGLLVGRPRALPALRDQLDQPLPDRRTA
jgi:3-phenylpropionate/trans-cinnamate dioxygenase ferredoxin reductase subunit